MARFAECDGVYWTEGKLRDGAPPGAFTYFGMTPERGPVGMYYMCPCGCESLGTLRFRTGKASDRPSWEWNGNVEKPTLNPSVNHLEADNTEHWHGWLKAGKWEST